MSKPSDELKKDLKVEELEIEDVVETALQEEEEGISLNYKCPTTA